LDLELEKGTSKGSVRHEDFRNKEKEMTSTRRNQSSVPAQTLDEHCGYELVISRKRMCRACGLLVKLVSASQVMAMPLSRMCFVTKMSDKLTSP